MRLLSGESKKVLRMREVEVWDHNGVNVALNKTASQSDTASDWGAERAVNGIFTDHSETQLDSGKYHFSLKICSSTSSSML